MNVHRPPDMSRAEREAVAAILALPDGPWEFVSGLTAAQWAADMAFAAESLGKESGE